MVTPSSEAHSADRVCARRSNVPDCSSGRNARPLEFNRGGYSLSGGSIEVPGKAEP